MAVLKCAWAVPILLGLSSAQEANQNPPPAAEPASISTQALTLSTNIPFFANGACNTFVSCEGLGTASVTTKTTTFPGLHPSGTALTITPTAVKTNGPNYVYVVPPEQDLGQETVTHIVVPGETVSHTIPTSVEPGAPGTVWLFPGGPAPTKTITITSTLTWGHAGDKTVTIGPSKYLPGIDPTVTVIPPVTTDLDISVCPPQATVTIIREPQQPAPKNITGNDGSIISRPPSKFPCSEDDLSPCRGTQVLGWTVFKTLFDKDHPWNGKTYPGPWKRTTNFDHDTILTVTDSWYQAERWRITLDGKALGETHEDGFKNNQISCSNNGDECIQKGFSHGSFLIPKGSHDLQIEWVDGPLTYSGGWWWTHGYGVYRFDKPCECAKTLHDEL